MIKIVADSKIPFLKGALESVAQVEYLPGKAITRSHIKDADALIIRTRTKCNRTLLNNTKVKYIATSTIGYDHIDAAFCRKAGIQWSNAPGCNSGSVQQYIASAICHIAQKECKAFADFTIGVIGVGHVGKKVEALARNLGMRVLLNDPPREAAEGSDAFTPLNSLLSQSDIVTLHVPLSKVGKHATYHFASNDFFSQIKKSAWLINAARGEVVKSESLSNALDQKRIAGAILDVWEDEPNINQGLLKRVDLSTPHIAGYSLDGKANGTAQSVRAISKFFNLGLDSWYPASIPKPEESSIALSGAHCDGDLLIHKLLLHTYNIGTDSEALRANPDNFEQLRDEYPQRREFLAYSIFSEENNLPAFSVLSNLGFKVNQNKY